ncbi:MAG TPA: four helix bundle protein [Steroidobacteraceae bacterium]|nr:four helix bundle protein [Steroidobacteraceae bacterium]
MTTRHEDLAAWRHSIALAAKVYAATRRLPSDEGLGLVGELRGAALSVPSSIAEGAARGRRSEFVHCLEAARAALSQLQTRMVIALGQELIGEAECPLADVTEVARDLDGLIRRVRSSGLAAHARACAPQRPAR